MTAKPKKPKKSKYCKFWAECDKEYECINGDFCDAFRSNPNFTTLRFDKEEKECG